MGQSTPQTRNSKQVVEQVEARGYSVNVAKLPAGVSFVVVSADRTVLLQEDQRPAQWAKSLTKALAIIGGPA